MLLVKPLGKRHKGAGPDGSQCTQIRFKGSAQSPDSKAAPPVMLLGLREAAISHRTSLVQKPTPWDLTPHPAWDESTGDHHFLPICKNGICGWLKVES